MVDLRDRLERLLGPGEEGRYKTSKRDGSADCTSAVPATLRERLEGLGEKGIGRWKAQGEIVRGLDGVLRGRELDTSAGRCYEVFSSFRAGYRHGRYRLEEFLSVDMQRIGAFCGSSSVEGLRGEEILFLDVETTGLSLGTGTYLFLIGLGYFREGKFCMHQLFLRDLPEEGAMLGEVARHIEGCRVLATFNGKTFDLPLLETRMLLNGLPAGVRDGPHWDLLHPARRLWRGRLEDCRMETIESERLGIRRDGHDVTGAEIPGIYYRFLHLGDTRDLDRIAYHNAVDVLSLTTLLTHLDRSLGWKDPEQTNLLATGRFYERIGMAGASAECFERAGERGIIGKERDLALLHLARTRKREGRLDEAVGIWEEMMVRDTDLRLDCCIEVARYYEHKAGKIEKAIEAVEFAIASTGPLPNEARLDLQKRLLRLQRKRRKA